MNWKRWKEPRVALGGIILIAVVSVAIFTAAALGASASRTHSESNLKALQNEFIALRRELDDLRRQVAILTESGKKRSATDGAAVLTRSFVATASMNDDPFIGPPSADTIVMVFTDFQCVPCRLFYRKALRELRERIATGLQIKLIVRDFPLEKNRFAPQAAQFAHCAGEQAKYWEAFDLLYAHADLVDVGDFEQLKAKLPELDQRKLTSCISSTRYASEVRKDAEDGTLLGAKGAPGTFVGRRESDRSFQGVFIRGAQPSEVILSEIERLAEGN